MKKVFLLFILTAAPFFVANFVFAQNITTGDAIGISQVCNNVNNTNSQSSCLPSATPTAAATSAPTATATATATGVPTASPTSEPTEEPTSEPTPEPTPLNCPEGKHIDASGKNCVEYQFGGPSTTTGGATTQGQVLGASTLAATGTFAENLYLAIMALGGLLTFKGVQIAFKKVR